MPLARKGVHTVQTWDRPEFLAYSYFTEADGLRIRQAEQRFN